MRAHNRALHVSIYISILRSEDENQSMFFSHSFFLEILLNNNQEVIIIDMNVIKNGLVLQCVYTFLCVYTWERSHAGNIDEV